MHPVLRKMPPWRQHCPRQHNGWAASAISSLSSAVPTIIFMQLAAIVTQPPCLSRTPASALLIMHIAHATAQAEHQAQSRPLPAITCRKRAAILQLPSGKDQPLLDRWDTSPILDTALTLPISSTASSSGVVICLHHFDKDLHAAAQAEHQVHNKLLPTVAVRKCAAILQLPLGKEPPRAEEHGHDAQRHVRWVSEVPLQQAHTTRTWALLLHLGYLKVCRQDPQGIIRRINTPNIHNGGIHENAMDGQPHPSSCTDEMDWDTLTSMIAWDSFRMLQSECTAPSSCFPASIAATSQAGHLPYSGSQPRHHQVSDASTSSNPDALEGFDKASHATTQAECQLPRRLLLDNGCRTCRRFDKTCTPPRSRSTKCKVDSSWLL
jgi:hypothetical protein